jgi:hypothetical protein
LRLSALACSIGVLVTLGACAAAEERPSSKPAKTPSVGSRDLATTSAVAPAPSICDTEKGIVLFAPDRVFSCTEEEIFRCTGEYVFGVVNCTDAPIVVDKITFFDERNAGITFEPGLDEIPPRGSFTHKTFMRAPDRLRATLYGWAEADAVETLPSAVLAERPVTLGSPTYDLVMGRCQACDGVWESGLSGTPSCNCKTTDAGKDCSDGDDCQGVCLQTGIAPDSPGFVRPIGKCSDRRFVRGCKAIIDHGARNAPPEKTPTRSHAVCVD